MIGVDLIKIKRMQRLMDRFGKKGLEKFLCQDEIALVKTAQNAAGFWAAKEACAKALQTGITKECGFKDMVLSKNDRGAPSISLAAHIMQRFHICDIALSITHDGEYAIAVVAIQKCSTTTNKVQ